MAALSFVGTRLPAKPMGRDAGKISPEQLERERQLPVKKTMWYLVNTKTDAIEARERKSLPEVNELNEALRRSNAPHRWQSSMFRLESLGSWGQRQK
jgi:hypothetical protein